MDDVDDFRAATIRLIENQPVLESFHRPTADLSESRILEPTPRNHGWHARKILAAEDEAVEKALGNLRAYLLL